ncbi:MAG: amidohydrolase family protein [Propionibacteriaceae bacterium]|nr:amidohydrolase family protein [Propionibacteriaceae bacterium]
MRGDLLVRDARLVPLGTTGEGTDAWADAPAGVVDVRIRDGVVAEIGPGLSRRGEAELAASGRWVTPGWWDAHVHAEQWVRSTTWLPMAGVVSAADACGRVAGALARRADAVDAPGPRRPLIGFGHRMAPWPAAPTVADLDAATGATPVVLIAGDVHSGWLNSAALAELGLPPRRDVLAEDEWFTLFARLGELPGADPTPADWASACARLAAAGITGIVDFELTDAWRAWPVRVASGLDAVRVRPAVYPHQLDAVIAAGLRTGDPLGSSGLVRLGPLKVIADGSMGTRTAWCCEPYAASPLDAAPAWCGAPNVAETDLVALLSRAHAAGLSAAVHAIGDRANQTALTAFAATRARGSIEHAQLVQREDIPRFAALNVTASVQPLHLVDDRDAAEAVWPDRTDRLYPFRSLLDAGARLRLGSDAPVSPPDPAAAMAAAVRRSGDERPAWHSEQALTWGEALAASVDGVRIAPGAPGDLVVLAGPWPPADDRSDPVVAATVCAGRVTWRAGGRGMIT